MKEGSLLDEEEVQCLPARTARGRLGYALLYVFARDYGRFPDEDDDLELLVRRIAALLGATGSEFARYDLQGRTAERHRAEIRERLGLREFSRPERHRFHLWLVAQLTQGAHAAELAESLRTYLKESGIEPPSAAYMDRVVRGAVHAFREQLHRRVSDSLGAKGRAAIDALVETDRGAAREPSDFATLRREPGVVGVRSILAEVEARQAT